MEGDLEDYVKVLFFSSLFSLKMHFSLCEVCEHEVEMLGGYHLIAHHVPFSSAIKTLILATSIAIHSAPQ